MCAGEHHHEEETGFDEVKRRSFETRKKDARFGKNLVNKLYKSQCCKGPKSLAKENGIVLSDE